MTTNHLLLPERIAYLCAAVHADNVEAGWWSDLQTGQRKERNVGELLMLVVSEIAEAAEGHGGALMDDKLPQYPMLAVELADMCIRIFDIAGAYKLDLGGAVREIGFEMDTDGVWRDGKRVGVSLQDSMTDALLRLVRHIARAMEGHRKGKNDSVMTYRPAFEVGLALAIVDAHHIAENCGYDLDAIIQAKRAFNRVREDHKIENRLKVGGKAY